MRKNKTGLTLVEVIVSIAVFSTIFISVSAGLYAVFNAWTKQKNSVYAIQNARSTMDTMVRELRKIEDVPFSNPIFSPFDDWTDSLFFVVNEDDQPAGDIALFYCYSDHFWGSGRGPELVRKTVIYPLPFWWWWILVPGWTGDTISDNIINDDHIIFYDTIDNAVAIELEIIPNPDQPEGRLNRSFRIFTETRIRG